jgi:hypothetical protein
MAKMLIALMIICPNLAFAETLYCGGRFIAEGTYDENVTPQGSATFTTDRNTKVLINLISCQIEFTKKTNKEAK